MSDIVRHLRDFASDYCTTTYHDELVRNAADAIEARDAEIERLRAALTRSVETSSSFQDTVRLQDKELQRLRAELAAAKNVIENIVVSEVEPLKAIMRECTPYIDYRRCPGDLINRIFDALGDGK